MWSWLLWTTVWHFLYALYMSAIPHLQIYSGKIKTYLHTNLYIGLIHNCQKSRGHQWWICPEGGAVVRRRKGCWYPHRWQISKLLREGRRNQPRTARLHLCKVLETSKLQWDGEVQMASWGQNRPGKPPRPTLLSPILKGPVSLHKINHQVSLYKTVWRWELGKGKIRK